MDDDHFLKRMFGDRWGKDVEKNAINIGGIFILAAIVFVLWGAYEWVIGNAALDAATGDGQKSTKYLEHLGSLGSFLQGTTASLWALAGFCVIFVAFLIQAFQLAEQRKQSKIQSESLARQNFEASFFQLLANHNQIVQGLSDVDPSKGGADVEARGRDCFKRWYRSFKTDFWGFKIVRGMDGGDIVEKAPKNNIEKYEAFYYDGHQAELGHYFRNLYHVFKFVDEAQALCLPNKDDEYKLRRRYTSIVRATLSQYELALLFYNCASELGEEKFMPLVEDYGLLKNFNPGDLLESEQANYPKPFTKKAIE